MNPEKVRVTEPTALVRLGDTEEMQAQRGDSKCTHGQQWWLEPTWPGTDMALVLLFQKCPQALFPQETGLSRGIHRKLLLLASFSFLTTFCIPQSEFGGGEVEGDIFKAISCLGSGNRENFDEALLKGTLFTQNRPGKGKLSTLSLSGHKLRLSDGFFLEFNLVLEAKLIPERFPTRQSPSWHFIRN